MIAQGRFHGLFAASFMRVYVGRVVNVQADRVAINIGRRIADPRRPEIITCFLNGMIGKHPAVGDLMCFREGLRDNMTYTYEYEILKRRNG